MTKIATNNDMYADFIKAAGIKPQPVKISCMDRFIQMAESFGIHHPKSAPVGAVLLAVKTLQETGPSTANNLRKSMACANAHIVPALHIATQFGAVEVYPKRTKGRAAIVYEAMSTTNLPALADKLRAALEKADAQ